MSTAAPDYLWPSEGDYCVSAKLLHARPDFLETSLLGLPIFFEAIVVTSQHWRAANLGLTTLIACDHSVRQRDVRLEINNILLTDNQYR